MIRSYCFDIEKCDECIQLLLFAVGESVHESLDFTPFELVLLDNDFMKPSQSHLTSPCILVPKCDGTF